MNHTELAQAAAEYAAAPESEERYKALWQAIFKCPVPDVCCTSGIVYGDLMDVQPIDCNGIRLDLLGEITTCDVASVKAE